MLRTALSSILFLYATGALADTVVSVEMLDPIDVPVDVLEAAYRSHFTDRSGVLYSSPSAASTPVVYCLSLDGRDPPEALFSRLGRGPTAVRALSTCNDKLLADQNSDQTKPKVVFVDLSRYEPQDATHATVRANLRCPDSLCVGSFELSLERKRSRWLVTRRTSNLVP